MTFENRAVAAATPGRLPRWALLAPFLAAASMNLVACSSSQGSAPGDGGVPDGRANRDGACSGSPKSCHDGAADARPAHEGGDARADSRFVEAPHAALPKIPNNGGPVIAAPKIVTITFAGYSETKTMSSFADWIAGSSWLTDVGKDYGVGAGTHAANVVLSMAAPAKASDLDTQALLEQKLGDGTLPSAQGPDAGASDGGADGGAVVPGDYLYVVIYPSGTTTGSFLAGPDTCTYEGGGHYIGGYHWETQSGAYHVPYAVIPTCSGSGGVEGAGDLEASASHEIIEASTDPYPNSATAYGIINQNDPWVATAGEVADLCEGQVGQQAGFSYQRVWSNSAAAAGSPPCIPAPPDGFFDTSPSPNTLQTVKAGSSVTLTLTGFSTDPLPPWSLSAFPAFSSFNPGVSLGAMKIGNGETTTLKITVPAGTPSMSYASLLVTSYRSMDDFNYWPVVVLVP